MHAIPFPPRVTAAGKRRSLSIVGCDLESQSLYGARGLTPDEFVALRAARLHRESRRAFTQLADAAVLSVPARMLSPFVPLHQDHRRDDHDRRSHEAKRIQRKSAPMKHKKVADPHGDGRQNDDEEGAVHGESFEWCSGSVYGQYVADVVSVSHTVTREMRAPSGTAFIWREVSS